MLPDEEIISRWIAERANAVAHEIGSTIRKELMAHYGTEGFPLISLQGRYEVALEQEMLAAYRRGITDAERLKIIEDGGEV